MHKIFFIVFISFSTLAHSYYFSPEIGYFNTIEGQAQSINMVNLVGNDYSIQHTTQNNFLLGLGAFQSLQSGWDWGIFMNYFNTTKVSGIIQEERLFSNLSYTYSVIQTPIYFSLKKNIDLNQPHLKGIVQAGIGPNIIYLYNYQETPLTSFSLSNHSFKTTTQAEFSAFAGLGILAYQKFDLSYRFYYLGKSALNAKNEGILSNLQTGTMYSNTLVLTYHLE